MRQQNSDNQFDKYNRYTVDRPASIKERVLMLALPMLIVMACIGSLIVVLVGK